MVLQASCPPAVEYSWGGCGHMAAWLNIQKDKEAGKASPEPAAFCWQGQQGKRRESNYRKPISAVICAKNSHTGRKGGIIINTFEIQLKWSDAAICSLQNTCCCTHRPVDNHRPETDFFNVFCSFFSNCLLAGCTNSPSPDQNTQPEVCPRLRVHLAVCITLPSPSFELK